jgi:hypothetical protein
MPSCRVQSGVASGFRICQDSRLNDETASEPCADRSLMLPSVAIRNRTDQQIPRASFTVYFEDKTRSELATAGLRFRSWKLGRQQGANSPFNSGGIAARPLKQASLRGCFRIHPVRNRSSWKTAACGQDHVLVYYLRTNVRITSHSAIRGQFIPSNESRNPAR